MSDLDEALELAWYIKKKCLLAFTDDSMFCDYCECHNKHGDNEDQISACEYAMKLAEAYIALGDQTRWIPVEEELPEINSEIFFWWKGLDNCYRWSLAKYEGDGVFWIYEMNREAAKQITHWRYIGGTSEPPPELTDNK